MGLFAISTERPFPAMPKPPYNVGPLIVIDPGHGGYDEGARVHSLLEKRMTLTTSLLTKRYLERMGHRVILTRSRDVYISLARRVAIANNNHGALFVSIHYNTAKNILANGIEIFYYGKEDNRRSRASRQLGNAILFHLLDQTGATSRRVKKGNHHVTRETEMPAVIVEGGFMTNPEEQKRLQERRYLDQIAKGVAEGIDKFVRQGFKERPRRDLNARPAA
jgi:N-acetylmuramoyl-L-alanine amidase